MLGNRQFSLGYLLLEIFWIASAIGVTRLVFLTLRAQYDWPSLLIPLGLVLWGIAIGGLFGRMRAGVMLGVAFVVIAAFTVTV